MLFKFTVCYVVAILIQVKRKIVENKKVCLMPLWILTLDDIMAPTAQLSFRSGWNGLCIYITLVTNKALVPPAVLPLNPKGLWGIVVTRAVDRAGDRTDKIPGIFLMPAIILGSISKCQGHQLWLDLGRIRLWRFCLIKYTHNGRFGEPINCGISELYYGRIMASNVVQNLGSTRYSI